MNKVMLSVGVVAYITVMFSCYLFYKITVDESTYENL